MTPKMTFEPKYEKTPIRLPLRDLVALLVMSAAGYAVMLVV